MSKMNNLYKQRKLSPLSLAVFMAAAGLPTAGQSETHAAISITDGSTVTVTGSEAAPVEFDDRNEISLSVINSGSTINASYINITTTGDWETKSIFAENGGTLNIDNLNVHNSTGDALGLFTGAGTQVTLKNATLTGNSGLYIKDGASVQLDNSTILAKKGGAISLSGEGATLYASDTNFTSGDIHNSVILPVININGNAHATLIGGSVTAYGTEKDVTGGIRLLGDSPDKMATLTLDGTTVTVGTADNPLKGIAVDVNENAFADINNSTLTTWGVGNGSSAIWLPDETDSVTVANSTLETHGDSAIGIEIYKNGKAEITDSSVKVYGNNTYGLYNNGANSQMIADGVDIFASGVTGIGAASYGGQLTVTDSHIATTGEKGYGVYVQNSTSDVTLDNSVVETSGASADAVAIGNGANMIITHSDIDASGDGAGGLRFFKSKTDAQAIQTTVSDSTINAENGAAIKVQGGSVDVAVKNSRISGDSDVLMQVNDFSTSIAAAEVSLTAESSDLFGDVVVNSATASPHIALRDRSLWKGTSQGNPDVQIDATSQWQVTGDASLAQLDNAGTVSFVAPEDASSFSTLRVNGDYIGDNGTLIFNRALGDSASPGDRLAIAGDTSGNTFVQVNNLHGAGGQTTADGIELIDVGGKSDGTFVLQGRAVAGSYEYNLWQGGVTDPDDGNWYLRSEKQPDPDPTPTPDPIPDPTPDPDPTPEPGPTPQYRPEPGAYLGNRYVAENLFDHSYHDRQGATWSGQTGQHGPLWLRTVVNETKGDAANGEISHTLDQTLIQLGATLLDRDWERQRFQAGLMGGYGYGRTKSFADGNRYSAIGHVDGYSMGIYATWLERGHAPGGAYVDSWLQYGRFNNDVSGEDLPGESYDSQNLSGSLETGYGFTFSNQWMLEPQMQAILNRYSADNHREANGTLVSSADNTGVNTRVGVRIVALQSDIQPWLTLNWLHDEGDDTMEFDGQRVSNDTPDNRAEIKAGVQATLAKGWLMWGQAGMQTGGQNYSQYGATIGVKYRW